MSESNILKLKNAYRHPFEYISPLLYMLNEKKDERIEGSTSELNANEIYCASEEYFNELFRDQTI